MFKNVKHAILLLFLTAALTACTNTVNANSPIPSEDVIQTEVEVIPEPEITEEEKAILELEKKIAEREELEKLRKEQQGEFYVPLVPLEQQREKKNLEIKALYLTGYTAGN
ncbi:MAG: hypothetical protein WBJ13_14965, partial [Sedimentibacter sp.]